MGENVHAGVGMSDAEEAEEAARVAIQGAREDVEGENDIGFLFCSSYYDVEEMVEAAGEEFGDIEWIGCTTCGELSNFGFSQKSAVAMIVGSEYMKFNVGVGEDMHDSPFETGQEAAKKSVAGLKADEYLDAYVHYQAMKERSAEEVMNISPYTLIAITSGFTKERASMESEAIQGIKDVVGDRVPIIGGASADDAKLEQNFQFHNGDIYDDAVIAVSILSDLKMGTGLAHGYESTGEVVFVDEVVNDRVVPTLNGEPAAEVYADLLGVDVSDLKDVMEFPTGARLSAIIQYAQSQPFGQVTADGKEILKVPIDVTDDNALVFAPKISENVALHLMEADKESIIRAADESVRQARSIAEKDDVGFAIVFDCSLRWMNLGEDTVEEIDVLRENIDAPFIGFYTYGELGSPRGSVCALNNETVTSLIVFDSLVAEAE